MTFRGSETGDRGRAVISGEFESRVRFHRDGAQGACHVSGHAVFDEAL